MKPSVLISPALLLLAGCLAGCLAPQLQKTELSLAGRGGLWVAVSGNFRTQATLADVDHLVIGLQTVDATASRTLASGSLTNGNASASVSFETLKPCTATVSVEAFDQASSSIGFASASVAVQAAKITHLTMSLQIGAGTIETGNLVADATILDSHYRTTTLAGNGFSGYADGTGALARFNNLYGLTLDASGNLFACDYDNYRIRKITPAGVVSTFAGDGVPNVYAPTPGTGTAAHFGHPMGIATAPDGNFYVMDYWGYCVEKMTPAGVVTIFASNLGNPQAIAVGPSGNIYLANYTTTNGNPPFYHTIYKITSAGAKSVLAGGGTAGFAEGTGASAKFKWPYGLAVDADENLYVADAGNYRIRKITPAGVVTTFAGSGVSGRADGTGPDAQFSDPRALVIDGSGNLFVGDSGRIRKITPSGVVSTIAGGDAGYADADSGARAMFGTIYGIAVDAAGNLFVSDNTNQAIRKLVP